MFILRALRNGGSISQRLRLLPRTRSFPPHLPCSGQVRSRDIRVDRSTLQRSVLPLLNEGISHFCFRRDRIEYCLSKRSVVWLPSSALTLAIAPVLQGEPQRIYSVGFANHFALCQTVVFTVVLRSDFRGDRSGNTLACHDLRHSPMFRESLAIAGAETSIAALGCIRSVLSLPHPCVSVPSHLQPRRVRSEWNRALRQGCSRHFFLVSSLCLEVTEDAASRAIFPVAKVGLTVQRKTGILISA